MLLAKLQNGFFEPGAVFLKDFPIPKVESLHGKILELLGDYLQCLALPKPSSKENEDPDCNQLMYEYMEKLLNGLVFELFFTDDLHSHNINLFKHVEGTRLPILADIPEKQRFSRLEEIYERISNDRHPIRGCLESLKSLEVVRIIEGKE
jgi:hypothetical protein